MPTHEIIIKNPIWAECGPVLAAIIKPCLSFKAAYWRQGPFKKERKEYEKTFLNKGKGGVHYFWAGLAAHVLDYCTSIDVDINLKDQSQEEIMLYEPELPGITFRPDQLHLINSFLDQPRGILVSFTGSGKTVLGFGILSSFENVKILWLCHKKDLMMQAYDEAIRFGFKSVGRYGDGFKEINKDIVIATRQSFKTIADTYGHEFDVIVVDECFAKGTMVNTYYGNVPIESITIGDVVWSDSGPNKVVNTFHNRVSLGRIVKITLSNGVILYCSEDHKLKIEESWVAAKESLGKCLTRLNRGGIMHDIISPKGAKNVPKLETQTMPKMQTIISTNRKHKSLLPQMHGLGLCNLWCSFYRQRDNQKVVLQRMFSKAKEHSTNPTRKIENLSCVRKIIHLQRFNQVLLQGVHVSRSREKEDLFRDKNEHKQQGQRYNILKNETKQPKQKPDNSCKADCYQAIEWYNIYSEEGWKWSRADSTAVITCNGVGLGYGSDCIWVGKDSKLSNMLQTRCRKSNIKNRYRSERVESFNQRKNNSGPKEKNETGIIRVESVEFYQRGGNDESFQSIIGDTERNQGYCTFYDLEVEAAHTYYVEEILVHNCHHVADIKSEYAYVLSKTPAPIRLGLTATIPREGEAYLTAVGLIGPILEEMTINKGAELGILAKPTIKILRVPKNYDMAQMRVYHEVYDMGVVRNLARNILIAKTAKKHVDADETVLIMINILDHGYLILEQLKAMGVDAEFVHGATDGESRNKLKHALNEGHIKCVICSSVWTEGVNIPNLNAVICASGGKSEIKTLQSIGRGLRKTKDKDAVYIYDFLDTSHKFLIEHFGERMICYSENDWI